MRKTGFCLIAVALALALGSIVCFAQANGGQTLATSPAKLTAADTQFLTDQCKIGQPDLDVIPKLSAKTQHDLLSRIAQKDCTLLQPFIASRKYFRSLDIKKVIPLPPPDGASIT
ncbi:MAG: hypothetical protein ABR905_05335 [Terracidiphilus sp.]|jgi:hypothetical protein